MAEEKSLYDRALEARKNKTNVRNIETNRLEAFEGHPYKVLFNGDMLELIESIRQFGIIEPIAVRKMDTGYNYEVISGHRRLFAARKLELKQVPIVDLEITRDEAAILVVDTNLHRPNILPSERAFAYKLKTEALSHQGQRTDLTSVQVAPKLSSVIIAESENISKDTVKRFIRLTYLVPELLNMVDEEKIAFTPAVELSYLAEKEQKLLYEDIIENMRTPSLSQACRLKKLSQQGLFNEETMLEIMDEEKCNQVERLKIPIDRLKKYFPKNYTTKQMEDEIIKMCEARYKRRMDRESR